MMKKIAALTGALILMLIVLEAGETELERKQWKLPVKEGVLMTARNDFGDVRLRKGGRNREMEVFAVFQQLREDGVRLEAEIRDDEFSIQWAHKPGKNPPPRPAGDRSRVDLVIRVPEGTELMVETEGGLIEAKGLRADLDLRSRKGEIRFSGVQGRVRADNKIGSITGVLMPGIVKREEVFRTRSGAIELWLSPDAHRTVLLRTSGKMTTDFSLEIEHHDGEEPEKYARAEVGGGGSEIRLYSKIGDLSIRREVVVRSSQSEKTEEGRDEGDQGDAAATQRGTPLPAQG